MTDSQENYECVEPDDTSLQDGSGASSEADMTESPMDVSEKATAEQCEEKHLPVICTVCYSLAAISAVLYFFFTKSPRFADWFNRNISWVGRRLLSYLTVWVPFSVAEWLLLLAPVFMVALIVVGCRRYADSKRNMLIFTGKFLSVLCAVAVVFVWNFAPGYYGATLDKKLELERREVSAQDLYQTALILSEELNGVSGQLIFPSDAASSVMPYSYQEMNGKLMDAYEKFNESYRVADHFYSRVKPVMLSEPMSYTHITGVYSFFTGEANINVNFPDYTIPFTAAHELAHQRGVAREDEANMVAFLVCMESDDDYIRYSALLNVYEYVASALYSADAELYTTVYYTLPQEVRQEQRAYREFFERYKDNTVADISEATNNAYLQSQGAKEGTRSYNMVVDLTVAYYRPLF